MHIEQNILEETVGCQDILAATFGGFNKFEYQKTGQILQTRIYPTASFLDQLQAASLLFFTGEYRVSNDITSQYVDKLEAQLEHQLNMIELAKLGEQAFIKEDIKEVGRLLNETWTAKQAVSTQISTGKVDEAYKLARRNGALGFKLLGGGGGGCVFLLVESEHKALFIKKLSEELGFTHIPFNYEFEGVKTVYYDRAYL